MIAYLFDLPVWYVLAFIAAVAVLAAVAWDMWRVRQAPWPYEPRERTAANDAADARPITRTRELTVLAEATAHVLNSAPNDEQRELLRDHFIAVLEEELRTGEYARLRRDVIAASMSGLRVSGGGGW